MEALRTSISRRSGIFGALSVGAALALFACSGGSGDDSSATTADSGTDQSDDGGTTGDGGRVHADGGNSSSDGGNPLPAAFQWHAGGLSAGQQYESLVAGADKVFAVQPASDVIAYAFDSSGKQLFATDVSTTLGTTITAPATTSLALETDETLLVVVRYDSSEAEAGALVKLNADGSIAWHMEPLLDNSANPGLGPIRGALTNPAIASDGTIYIVARSLNTGDDGVSQVLLSISPTGVVNFSIDIAYDTDSPGAPWIAPNGNVGVLVTSGGTQTIKLVTPATQAITTVTLAGTLSINGITPLPDGSWLASTVDASRNVAITCDGADEANFQPEEAHYGADGSLLWHTDIRADEISSQIVTGTGTDALVAWGNCMDGTGAGLYTISQTTGAITQTFGNTLGDGLAALGGSTDAYLLVQNDTVSGVESGPVVEAVNRSTGVADSMIALPCAAPGHASSEYAEMTILGSSTLIVSCGETPEIPGGGGLYALKMPVALASDNSWPYPNGNAFAARNLAP